MIALAWILAILHLATGAVAESVERLVPPLGNPCSTVHHDILHRCTGPARLVIPGHPATRGLTWQTGSAIIG